MVRMTSSWSVETDLSGWQFAIFSIARSLAARAVHEFILSNPLIAW